jgi:hypothetical protein
VAEKGAPALGVCGARMHEDMMRVKRGERELGLNLK